MAKRTDGSRGGGRDAPVPGVRAAADPRVVLSRERVLAAALDLLTESGLGELTIDDVSKRSGVAKTTLYRPWPNRAALVFDACLRMDDGDQPPPDTGSLEGDVSAFLKDLAGLLVTERWSSILPSIVDAEEHEPTFADIHSTIQRRHAAPLRAALERAVARGEIAPSADLSAVVAALLGPLFYRRWFSREPVDDKFVDLIVATVLAAVPR
ncbi:MAG: TetR/AcrR family transcriptional regulator C-terminal ligand-binding domain-containing protein [Trebonia sp.]